MDDPQRNPFWDAAFGGDSIKGTLMLVVYPLAFAVLGGTLFYLLGS